MALVIDASIALAWCFADEASAESDRLLEEVTEIGAVVPLHWRLEMSNALIQGEKRNRISIADVRATLDRLERLPIEADQLSHSFAWTVTLELARQEKLTPYDAAYLELAIRRRLPLATRDGDLLAAARRLGVTSAL